MYEVFDDFCRRPTWDTSHPSDLKVFRAALRSAIGEEGFSPAAMGNYIRSNHADPIWPKSKADFEEVIEGLIREARTALLRTRP